MYVDGGICGEMVSMIWNIYDNMSSNLDVTVCISLNSNTHGKGKNSIIVPSATGKIVGQTVFFSLNMATGLSGGKHEFKPVKLYLKLTLCLILSVGEG